MLLGTKPMMDMSEEEMILAITELQGAREALRAEAVRKKEAGQKIVKEKRAKDTYKSNEERIIAELLAGGAP